MKRCRYTLEQLALATKESFSIAEVCRKLDIRPCGGNYKTIKTHIKDNNVDNSHFTGQGWNVGKRYKSTTIQKDLNDILIENSSYKSTHTLRLRLINEGFKEQKCECCNLTTWLDKPIKLELHHINGNNMDNRIENLLILCPNCHSYTDTFRYNKRSSISDKRKEDYDNYKDSPLCEAKIKTKIIKIKEIKVCENCGEEFIPYKRQKYCSMECYREVTRKNIPNVFELIDKFKELKTYVKVGDFYGVSNVTVKKWCRGYKINDNIKIN